MLYIILWIVLLIMILIIFLYNIWKDEDLLDNNESGTQDEFVEKLKNSSIDKKIFFDGLKNLDIKNETVISLKNEINKSIVGMDEFINSILINVFTWWHLLVEWPPWLAKTKTITSISKIMSFSSKRIQFTPDMLPADIMWVEIFNTKTNDFEIKKWPVFTNILLADEINRTTPKVQSALLESMQEKQVSIWWETFNLPYPFFVLATQNPIEQEWTYQLPEAQLDRFLMKVIVDYPNIKDENNVLNVLENENNISLQKIISIWDFEEIKSEIEDIVISDDIKDYIVRLVNSTRKKDERVLYGASPRWSISLMNASKTLAYILWRDYVIHEDIQKLALLVLRHRVILTYDAIVDGLNVDDVVCDMLSKVSLE